jgi:hypothetical protein
MRALKSPTGGEVTVGDDLVSELLAQGWTELGGSAAKADAAAEAPASDQAQPAKAVRKSK